MLSSRQISEWEAYDRLDPIGSWREDFRFAQLMSLLVNIVTRIFAPKGHTPKNVSPLDFMPQWGDFADFKIEKPQQSVEEMKQILLSIASSQNKKVKNEVQKNNTIRTPLKKKKNGL